MKPITVKLDLPQITHKGTLEPKGIVIHAISERLNGKAAPLWMAQDFKKASAHSFIGADAKIYQWIDEDKKAWHAGASLHESLKNLNHHYLGVEVMLEGQHTYEGFIENINNTDWVTPYQYKLLAWQCNEWMQKYNIELDKVVGHDEVSPGRKQDPGEGFKWEMLYELIYDLQESQE